LPIH
jgi:hypothetical protein